jgi:hypothetical protein
MKRFDFCRLTAIVMVSVCFAVSASAQFSGGGTGTEQDPFRIVSAADLDKVRNFCGGSHADKYFLMMNDIDLTGFLKSNEGWLPVGDENNKFTGHFDGGGNEVKGLRIKRTVTNRTYFKFRNLL